MLLAGKNGIICGQSVQFYSQLCKNPVNCIIVVAIVASSASKVRNDEIFHVLLLLCTILEFSPQNSDRFTFLECDW